LERGEWDGFWEHFGAPVPEADRLTMEASDPRAMAAVQIGRQRSGYVLEPSRVRAPTFLYYGPDDAWAPTEAAGEAFGVKPHVLDGRHDHSTAIRDVDVVAPIVLDFLRAGPANHSR
jgi:pimeloyl-ACP methyl ester carboxylesterase